MARRRKGTRIAVFADLHAGSAVAPWPEDQPLADGGRWQPNKFQRWLGECWAEAIAEVRKQQPTHLVMLGDMIQGTSHKDGQLVTSRVGFQIEAAAKLLQPLVDLCPVSYYVAGTEWHEGRSAENVEPLAEILGCKKQPQTGTRVWRQLYLDINGRVIQFMHAISTTSIAQYAATAPLRDGLNHKLELVNTYGDQAPHLAMIVRAHRHRYIDVNDGGIRAVVTPCWQLATAMADAKCNATLPHIGWLMITGDEDGLEVKCHRYPVPMPHVEVSA